MASGVQIGIVIGGGNIFRGLSGAGKGFDRVKGDQMGMLATVINSLGLSSALESIGQPAQVFTAINMFPIGEHYSKWKAIEALNAGKVAIMSCGTGNHLMLVDLTSKNITGKVAQNLLDEVGITANKNTIPFEKLSPFVTSGIRLGSPALTTRGFKEDDMVEVANIIALVLDNPEDESARGYRCHSLGGQFPNVCSH